MYDTRGCQGSSRTVDDTVLQQQSTRTSARSYPLICKGVELRSKAPGAGTRTVPGKGEGAGRFDSAPARTGEAFAHRGGIMRNECWVIRERRVFQDLEVQLEEFEPLHRHLRPREGGSVRSSDGMLERALHKVRRVAGRASRVPPGDAHTLREKGELALCRTGLNLISSLARGRAGGHQRVLEFEIIRIQRPILTARGSPQL